MKRELDSQTLIRPAKFSHIVLRTRDLEAAVSWYETVLGMETVFRNSFVAFMTYDEEHHRLALVATPQQTTAPEGAAGLDHAAYTLADLGQLFGTYSRLKAVGILPVWAINHGPTTSLYYADPDGNRIEFLVDNFDSEAELKGWLRTDAFVANPIGIEFDVEKLIQRYRDGEPIDALKRQGAA